MHRIVIADGGPYLVYGQPPLVQQFIMPNGEGEIWYFKEGAHYSTKDEPTALCRCGYSKNKPYCDGSHEHADWDPALTASTRPLLEDAEQIDGPEITLTDNEKYCALRPLLRRKGPRLESGRRRGTGGCRTDYPGSQPLSGQDAFPHGKTTKPLSSRISIRASVCSKILCCA